MYVMLHEVGHLEIQECGHWANQSIPTLLDIFAILDV